MADSPLRGTANKSIAKPKLILPLFPGSNTSFTSPKLSLTHVANNSEALKSDPVYAAELESVKAYYRNQLEDSRATNAILTAKLHKANEACRYYKAGYNKFKSYAKRLESQNTRGNGTTVTLSSCGILKPVFDSSLDEYGTLLTPFYDFFPDFD